MKKKESFLLKRLGIPSIIERLEMLDKNNQELKKNQDEVNQTILELLKQNEELTKKCGELNKRLTHANKKNERIHRALVKQIDSLETQLFPRSKGLAQKSRSPRIIVSVTSYPARIHAVVSVLERMLIQTLSPDKIVLWLSKDQFTNLEADLPEKLLALQKDGVEICWCDGDVKSYKKILPALNNYPDDLIITIDDDLFYRVTFLEELYRAHETFPDAIIASRVHQIVLNRHGKIAPYENWEKECDFDVRKTRGDWFFTSGAGTLFPPHVFGEEVFNMDVIKTLCPHADDIWLNIHAAMNQVPIVNIASNNMLICVKGTQADCLWDINREQNDVQLKNVVTHYKEQLKDSIYKNM